MFIEVLRPTCHSAITLRILSYRRATVRALRAHVHTTREALGRNAHPLSLALRTHGVHLALEPCPQQLVAWISFERHLVEGIMCDLRWAQSWSGGVECFKCRHRFVRRTAPREDSRRDCRGVTPVDGVLGRWHERQGCACRPDGPGAVSSHQQTLCPKQL